MNKLFSTALFVPIVWLGLLPFGSAQAQINRPNLDTRRNALQTAVCLNDWAEALAIINPMIGSSEITAGYREELMRYRRQIQTWRDAQADLSNRATCVSIIAEAEAETAAEEPAREETFQAAEAAPQWAIASQTERQTATVSVAAQCSELTGVIEWGAAEMGLAFGLLFSQSDIPANVAAFISGLENATVSLISRLQALQITDAQLRFYQQRFVSIYQSTLLEFRRDLETTQPALQTGSPHELKQTADALNRQANQFDQLTRQEETLLNQMSAYCGSNSL